MLASGYRDKDSQGEAVSAYRRSTPKQATGEVRNGLWKPISPEEKPMKETEVRRTQEDITQQPCGPP